MKTRPVSVVAISYNNASAIIETLNSIFQQDYENIELIIADDCSTDGTLAITEEWLKKYSHRFKSAILLDSKSNQGICRNLSRGIEASTGDWIKPLACDDILLTDAISKFVFQTMRDQTELAFSQITAFSSIEDELIVHGNICDGDRLKKLCQNKLTLLREIRKENLLPAPGAFYSRRLLAGAGGIDIRYKHMDDWPLWLRMLPHVDRLSWIDKPLVLYRIGQTSVSQRSRANPINPILHNDREKLYRDFQKKQLDRCNRWHQRLQIIRNKLTLTCLRNTWLGYRLMMTLQLLSPILYKDLYIKGKNKLRSILKNIIPISRGFWYFGMRGLLNRVRVFGPISIRIPVNRIVLGQHVSIYEGVTLNGKLDSEDIIEIGEHSIIEKNAYINSHGGKITLGKRVHIGVGCILQGMGNLCIANETMLGPHVQIYTSNHRSSSPQLPRRLLGERLRPVSVGFNCWIGAGSILLPGSHLAAGSVLAAGTVVRREKVEIIE